jgi:23S rRNA pseudouridine2457 synthase
MASVSLEKNVVHQSIRSRSSGQIPCSASIHRYVLFNKPYNVLCQFSDRDPTQHSRLTLKDYLPIPDIYPVGRLDQDSEGLVLLTNHGALQHQLSHPRFGHPRTYWVQVEGNPSDRDLDPIRQGGLAIQTYRTRPAQVKQIPEPDLPPRNPPIRFRRSIPTHWLELTLTEGHNRQVRRMTAKIGFPTLRLVRVAIGSLQLGDLGPGEWRELTLKEQKELLQVCQHHRSDRRSDRSY